MLRKLLSAAILSIFLPFFPNAQFYFDWADEADFYALDNNPRGMTTDSKGNLYFIGTSATDFDPSPVSNMTPEGHPQNWFWDYLTCYDSLGGLVWTKGMYSNKSKSELHDLYIDASDNFYILGTAIDTVDLVWGLDSSFTIGRPDTAVFLAKYDSDLQLQWVSHFKKTYNCNPKFIRADGSGNVFVTGTFNTSLNPDPGGGGGNQLLASGSNTIFIAGYNSSGQFSWGKSIGGNYSSGVEEMIATSNGKLVICGNLWATSAGATAGSGSVSFTLNASQDAGFYVQFNSATGNAEYGRLFHPTGNAKTFSVTTDGSYLYFCGRYAQNIQNNIYAGFIAKCDFNGNQLWYYISQINVNTTTNLDYLKFVPNLNAILITGQPGNFIFPDSTYSGYHVPICVLDTSGRPIDSIPGFEAALFHADDLGRLYFSDDFYNQITFTGSGGTKQLNTFPVNDRHQYFGRIVPWCEPLSVTGSLADTTMSCIHSLNLVAPVQGTGLMFQWYQETSDLEDVYHGSLGVLYAGTQEKNLVVSVTTAAGALGVESTWYLVEVTDGCGNSWTSNNAYLIQYNNPFTTPSLPTQVSVTANANTVLTVPAWDTTSYSASVLSWEWWKGSSFLLFDNVKFSGTNTTSLSITNCIPTDGGLYYAYPVNQYCPDDPKEPWVFFLNVTGVSNEPELENKLSVYPNPAKDAVSIEITEGEIQDIRLLDISGKSIPIEWNGSFGKYSANWISIPNGMYFLHIQSGDQVSIHKIIIQP